MERDFADRYHRLEDTHWWFTARRDMILRLLKGVPENARILDVGCSGGALLRGLKAGGFRDLTGVDIDPQAVRRCAESGFGKAVVMDASALSFDDNSFDVLIASDVLEHIADPRKALASWQRVLRPGGRLIVFVPGHPLLWSGHDVVNRHFRRYRRGELVSSVTAGGFTVLRCSGWNLLLLLPALLMAVLRGVKLLEGAGGFLREAPGMFNRLLVVLLISENRLIQQLDMLTGLSYFALAEKDVNSGVC